METLDYSTIRIQLTDRKIRLQKTLSAFPDKSNLIDLLKEVDSALERMDRGVYGLCEVCHENIEPDRLLIDPLVKVCLDHLDNTQLKTLESDLEAAAKIQRAFLPPNNVKIRNWEISYHYQPVGIVSGDYCDILSNDETGEVLFLLGDVSGKGIPASMLMSYLHALFHSANNFNIPVRKIVEDVNRLFCESTLSSYYATLVCGRADTSGKIEICNAGHCLPIIIQNKKVINMAPSGLPIGLFCNSRYETERLNLDSGDKLILYSDGLSEAFHEEIQYSEERIMEVTKKNQILPSAELLKSYLEDLAAFNLDSPLKDDLTIMVISRL